MSTNDYYNELERIEYFKFDKLDKLFIQSIVYHEYLTLVEQERFKRHSKLTIKHAIAVDLALFRQEENYELCQLLSDVLKRFDKEFDDFK